MVAYVNRRAVQATFDRRRAVFWSTSKDELHDKGSTSGDVLEIVDVRVNCENNSLLYRVNLGGGGACHLRDHDGDPPRTCFFRPLDVSNPVPGKSLGGAADRIDQLSRPGPGERKDHSA